MDQKIPNASRDVMPAEHYTHGQSLYLSKGTA